MNLKFTFQWIPQENEIPGNTARAHDILKRISFVTKLEMSNLLTIGASGKFIDLIFPQKEFIDLTTIDRFIDFIASVNDKILNRTTFQSNMKSLFLL